MGGCLPLTTLASSATFLSSQACKSLLAQVTLLAQDSLPELANLSAWWTTVKSAIQSLDGSFVGALYDPLQFNANHLHLFGPVVLGARGWL